MGTAHVAHMQRLMATYSSCPRRLCQAMQGASQQSSRLVGHWGAACCHRMASRCAAGLASIQHPRLTFRRALQKPKLVLCPSRVTCSQVDTLREKRPSSSVLHCSSTQSDGSAVCTLSRKLVPEPRPALQPGLFCNSTKITSPACCALDKHPPHLRSLHCSSTDSGLGWDVPSSGPWRTAAVHQCHAAASDSLPQGVCEGC